MVTELRQTLSRAADDDPSYDVDLAFVVGEGARRVRRRRARVLVAAALTAAVVTAALAVPQLAERSERPDPAAPFVLDPGDARPVTPEILLSRRTTWRDPANELDHDLFLGLTEDGLALRSRYTYDGDVSELGLTDPDTGRTTWLPRPPGDLGEPRPLELGADELVLLDNRHSYRAAVLRFDRRTDTWSRAVVSWPKGRTGSLFGVFGGQLGDDGLLYLRDTEPPSHWWTAPASTGGAARPRPELDGLELAWGDDAAAVAHVDGTVEVTYASTSEVVRIRPPAGCDPLPRPEGMELAMSPTMVTFAGRRPVVSFTCRQGAWTVVHEPDGRPYVAVEPGQIGVRASGHRLVVLTDETSTYLLDLAQRELLRLDASPHENQIDVVRDLVLWNTPGPIDDRDTYDVVWNVARLP